MANANPTPKQRLQAEKKLIEAHRALLDRPELELGIDYAILEYQRILTETAQENFNIAAANHFRMAGAMEFLRIFRGLGEMTSAPTIVDRDNLKPV